MFEDTNRPNGWIPTGARLVQLRDRRKRPATSTGHLAGVLAEDFVPLGQNIGIVLDENFIVIDIDEPGNPRAAEWLAKLPATWTQSTPRGEHRLFRTPVGWRGTNLPKEIVGFGDVKSLGYIVAPGSAVDPDGEGHPGGVYRLVDARDPVDAPAWLLGAATRNVSAPAEGEEPATERDVIADGERDNELASIAGFLRSHGFSQSALTAMLNGIIDSGVVEQPTGREVTGADVARIAKSIAKKPPGKLSIDAGAFLPAEWLCGDEVPVVPPVISYILPGFVPAIGLTILYGDGKIGKSSWASWLASRVTQTGKGVIFIGSGEETFELFVQRARLTQAVDTLLFKYPMPEKFWLPQSVPMLEQALEFLGNVGLVYIDAIYSHFAPSDGQNTAERARSRLRALGEMSIAKEVAVLGTIHENAAGGMLGSREMRNVARALLHAKRKKDGDFTIWGKGANGFQADYGVRFPGTQVPILDPATGVQRTFTDLFGDVIPQTMWSMQLGSKVGGDDENEIGETIRSGDIQETARRGQDKKETAIEY